MPLGRTALGFARSRWPSQGRAASLGVGAVGGTRKVDLSGASVRLDPARWLFASGLESGGARVGARERSWQGS